MCLASCTLIFLYFIFLYFIVFTYSDMGKYCELVFVPSSILSTCVCLDTCTKYDWPGQLIIFIVILLTSNFHTQLIFIIHFSLPSFMLQDMMLYSCALFWLTILCIPVVTLAPDFLYHS